MQQQIQNKPLTPLEKLIFDKEQIRRQCVVQEQKLNDDFLYIQENAGSLLISGLPVYSFQTLNRKKQNRPTLLPPQTTSRQPRSVSPII